MAQIMPTTMKSAISTSIIAPVSAEIRKKSPRDRNFMVRSPYAEETAPASEGKQGAGRTLEPFLGELDAFVRRQGTSQIKSTF